MRPLANRTAAALAAFASRSEVGGSDAHAIGSVGCAYTEVPGARTRQEYLDGLRAGHGRVFGESGSYWKLTRDVYSIACAMVRELPFTLSLAPLFLAVPLVTLGNLVRETVFAQAWSARYLHSLRSRTARRAALIAAGPLRRLHDAPPRHVDLHYPPRSAARCGGSTVGPRRAGSASG